MIYPKYYLLNKTNGIHKIKENKNRIKKNYLLI